MDVAVQAGQSEQLFVPPPVTACSGPPSPIVSPPSASRSPSAHPSTGTASLSLSTTCSVTPALTTASPAPAPAATAVLGGINPRELIEELEKVDYLEYNPNTPNPPSKGVIIRKRSKLHETWDRVIKLCEKDAPEQCADMERLMEEYYGRLREKLKYYQQVKLQGFYWY